jgi:hypothetical protein
VLTYKTVFVGTGVKIGVVTRPRAGRSGFRIPVDSELKRPPIPWVAGEGVGVQRLGGEVNHTAVFSRTVPYCPTVFMGG